jgi:transposase
MNKMPSRDTSGRCKGGCRDRVFEGEKERQRSINKQGVQYSSPAEESPSWTSQRNDPPGYLGGRV